MFSPTTKYKSFGELSNSLTFSPVLIFEVYKHQDETSISIDNNTPVQTSSIFIEKIIFNNIITNELT